MKNRRKLLSSVAALLLSATMLGTSTYAWFTMNKEARITNMNLKVKTSNNLLISATNENDGTYTTALTDNKYVLLEPTSTINGETFYYTLDGAADGHKIHGPNTDNPYVLYSESAALSAEDEYADKDHYDAAFNNAYGIETANTSGQYNTAYGYYDYIVYLKASSVAANQDVVLNKCNLLYNGSAVTEKAWRIAVFSQETTAETQPTTLGNLVSIIALPNAENQQAGKSVNSTTTLESVANSGSEVKIDTMAANKVKYYKVVIRVWIEGEDKTCTSSIFNTKTEGYTLDLSFSIDENTSPITTISSTTT